MPDFFAITYGHGTRGLILFFSLSYFALFPDSIIGSFLHNRARTHMHTLQK